MIPAYPLAWPEGWKRTPAYQRAGGRFTKRERHYNGASSWNRARELSVADGVQRVLAELERMGIDREDIVISTNLRTRLDGMPRSGQAEPSDPGAAVYWEAKREHMVMAIDRYERVADNLAAIAATLDAMRAIERHGGAQILERAFTGFTALPAPGQTTGPNWRDVLGDAHTRAELEERYRIARSQAHPDKGGTSEQFQAVQRAYEIAAQEIGA